MQAVVLILESDNVADVKEQAICILANIADGDSAKSFIMSNEVWSLPTFQWFFWPELIVL